MRDFKKPFSRGKKSKARVLTPIGVLALIAAILVMLLAGEVGRKLYLHMQTPVPQIDQAKQERAEYKSALQILERL